MSPIPLNVFHFILVGLVTGNTLGLLIIIRTLRYGLYGRRVVWIGVLIMAITWTSAFVFMFWNELI